MSIFCKELNKSFDNKEDLFKELVKNEKPIIDAKKSEIYFSCNKVLQNFNNQSFIEKAFIDAEKAIKFDSDYYYFVVNSADILDSHKDVHLDGNWNRTVKSQQGKNYLVWAHDFKNPQNILYFPEDVEMMTAKVDWSLLGKNYEGSTYCLIYKCRKDKMQNDDVKDWIEEGKKLQLSVRMEYIKVEMAFKSDNPDYAKYNKVYEEIYPKIVNKDEFDSIDYFYAVREAKNIMESSILPFGSNPATREISSQKGIDTSKDTQDNDPPQGTQTKKQNVFIKI